MIYKKHRPRRHHRGGPPRLNAPHPPGLPGTHQPSAELKIGPHGAPPLRIYALGGLEEVGRNSTVFECGDDIVIVDLGLMFPEEDMPGIDYIIPDISSLRGKEKNIRGIIVTHGHYDHIGGIPHLLGKLGNPPIYTAPLTAGIIRKRQEEFPNGGKLNIALIKGETKIQLGKHFLFEPFHINHNISDAFGAALQTPYGWVLCTGDFKFDYTPVNDEPADLNHIALFGARGVLALFSDSTDATSPGHQISEKTVGDELREIVAAAPGRVIVGTFSSLLTRIQQLITIAEGLGRKVLLVGRSLNANVEIAKELGYMKYKQGTLIEEHEFRRLPPEKLVIICTGAQGERNAVLMRIANSEHQFLSVQDNDTIIFSSSVIPGNERTVQSLKDALVRQGARIVHYANMDVHAGGHAKQEDLKLMVRLTKPRYFIPVHGNRFMLQAHAELAEHIGIPKEQIFVADNGQIMDFGGHGGKLTKEYVPTEHIMVDGLGVGDVSHVILRERRQLAEDGMFVVIVTIDQKTGALIGSPDIISRGFVYMKESRELIEKARARIKKILKDSDRRTPAFEDYIRNKIRNEVGQFLFSQMRRRPMILPVLIEV
ncbi:ribonuclease J [Candidatus Uhrbacteria bacterium]|nr:ribonuclease J [Candidatus Uhrbacteria bacterium]